MDYENIQRMIRDGELDGSAHFIEPDHSDCCPRCGWISVDDRLPEPNTTVLVGHVNPDYGDVTSAYWQGGKFWDTVEGIFICDATHWQPLPDPPEKQPESE